MTRKERQLAKALAVRYEAFMAYHNANDRRGRAVWAGLLKEAQEAIGIELVRVETLETYGRMNQ